MFSLFNRIKTELYSWPMHLEISPQLCLNFPRTVYDVSYDVISSFQRQSPVLMHCNRMVNLEECATDILQR